MKKLLVVLAALVVSAAQAAVPVKTFYWTGAAGTDSWKTPGNWQLNNEPCTDDYPHAVGDDAYFEVSATVTLDTGCATPITRVAANKSGVTVKIYGTEGSSFVFTPNAPTSYSGLNAVVGATNYLYAAASTDSRYDPVPYGQTYYCGAFTNTSYTSYNGGLYYNYGPGCDFYTTKPMDFGWGRSNGETVKINFLKGAKLTSASNARFSICEGKSNAEIVQEEGTVVTLSYAYLGGRGSYTSWAEGSYLMKGGELNVDYLYVGNTAGFTFTQEGGTNRVTYPYFGNSGSLNQPCVYNLKGGLFEAKLFQQANDPAGRYAFNHSGGTLSLINNDCDTLLKFNFSGAPTVNINDRTFVWRIAPSFARGTKFTLKGTTGKVSVLSRLDISDNEWDLQGGTFQLYADIYPVEGVTNAWKVKIGNGAKLALGYRGSRDSRIYTPLELEIADGGKFGFSTGECDGHYVRSITTNGVKLAKGVYRDVPFNLDRSYADILIPYVWTGGGDGKTWNDGANWDTGTVPPNDTTTPVDISAATEIELPTGTLNLRGLCFCPVDGHRKVTLKGSGVLKFNGSSYNFSTMVRPDCTVAFDVDVSVEAKAFLTGGTFAFKKSIPIAYGWTYFGFWSGTLLFDGATGIYKEHSGDCTRVLFESAFSEPPTVVFDGGTDVDLGLPILSSMAGGYRTMGRFVHRDAKLTITKLCLQRMTNAAIYPEYQLQGGELTATTGVYLNGGDGGKCWARGSLTMTGGKLTTPLLSSENMENYFYLQGGDAYIGAGGIQKGALCEHGSPDVNVNPGLQLGGVRLHATDDFAVTLDTAFTSVGGDTEIDTDGHTVTFAAGTAVSGAGNFTKTGDGELVFAGRNGFTGTLSVTGGKVSYAAGAEVTASPESIVLGSADQLSLAEGVELTVGALTVGGVPQSGTVPFGEGSVTVVDPGVNRFIGASGAKWSVGANWSQGEPPADGAAVDLTKSCLPGDFEIELDTDVSFASFAYAGVGENPSLTFTGTGKVVIPATATLTVSAGSTLAFGGNVTIGDADEATAHVVTLAGGGRTVFAGSLGNGAGTETLNDKYELVLSGSGAVEFDCTVTGVSIVASATATSDWTPDAQIMQVKIGPDGDVPFGSVAPFVNLVDVVQDGGRVTFNSDVAVCNGARVRYCLNAGTLAVGAANLRPAVNSSGALTGSFQLSANGGTIETSSSIKSPFHSRFTVVLGGTLTLAQAESTVATTFINDFTGAGKVIQAGPGAAALSGATFPDLTEIDIQAGTLSLGIGAAEAMAPDKVSVAVDAVLGLADGTMVTRTLSRGGKQLVKGLYGADVSPRTRRPTIVGDGFLNVLEGEAPGVLILVR